MKKLIPLILVAVTIMACSIIPTPKPEPTEFLPPVTEPPATEPPATEPPAVDTPTGTVFTCNEISFILDPTLGTNIDCQTVPESPYEMELYPEHTQVILQGYPLADKFFEPRIMVYSVAEYTALSPTVIPERVTALQNMVAGGHNPLYKDTSSKDVPFLPTFPAIQAFYSKGKLQPFVSGIGVRFLTEYAQYFVPVNNHDLFYTYQGLTNDGQYWIAAILPINHPMLPANADTLPGGVSPQDFSATYETYIVDTVTWLNARPPESFIPGLLTLDALVTSITITP